MPEAENRRVLLEVKNLKKHFPVRHGLFGRGAGSGSVLVSSSRLDGCKSMPPGSGRIPRLDPPNRIPAGCVVREPAWLSLGGH